MTTIALTNHDTRASRALDLRAVLGLLTCATGLIDAASYLGMGHVFVANMTGNVVFLGFALAGAEGFSLASFAVALGSFLVGAALGGRLGVALSSRRRRWLIAAASVQVTLAGTATITVAGAGLDTTGVARLAVIALLAVGMGAQNATVRRLAVPDLTTTVLTMTLTGLAADSSAAGGNNPRLTRRITAVAATLVGAVIGAGLVLHAGVVATLAVLTAVYAVAGVGFAVLDGESTA
jgi:uncharacterized membrane protein YoaK (UPF0700 family)